MLSFKTKTKIKIAAKSVGLCLLILGGLVFAFFQKNDENLSNGERELGGCDKEKADPPGLVVRSINCYV